jgi:hypothetical protein
VEQKARERCGGDPTLGPTQTALRIEVEHERFQTGMMDLGCFTSDGVTVEVVGHPEARATSPGSCPWPRPPRPPVVGSKPGCYVTHVFDQFTGRSLIRKGAVSIAHLRVYP